jgi:hypothetical protein
MMRMHNERIDIVAGPKASDMANGLNIKRLNNDSIF